MNLNELAKTTGLRILAMGFPGTGKTGALAALVNAGWKLRILDFDRNWRPLVEYIKPEFRHNVDIFNCEDKLWAKKGGVIEPMGTPAAFANALAQLNDWKYTAPDGSEQTYGSIETWGPDVILVVDSMTGVGASAERRILTLQNRSRLDKRRQDWGVAADEQNTFYEMLRSDRIKCHVYCTAHLALIGPKMDEFNDKASPVSKDTLKDKNEERAELIAERFYPRALTKSMSTVIAGNFPIALAFESKEIGSGKVKRIIRTVPKPELDVKVPSPKGPDGKALLPDELPLEDGLLTIFQTLAPLQKKETTNG